MYAASGIELESFIHNAHKLDVSSPWINIWKPQKRLVAHKSKSENRGDGVRYKLWRGEVASQLSMIHNSCEVLQRPNLTRRTATA
jgi:hypothetical protein